MFRGFSLNRMLVLAVTGCFAFLFLDVILEHRDVLSREIMAYIPVVTSALVFIVGLVAVARWNAPAIKLMRVALMISLVVGLGGIYFHVKEEDEEEKDRPAVEQQRSNGEQEEEKEKEKSPIAPLAFTGLAALGLLGTSMRWRAEDPQGSSRPHAR